MLGASTIAMSRAWAAMSAFCASLKPVVPITALTPSSRQIARCASVPSGRVKSISTCAAASAARGSPLIATPRGRLPALADAPGCRRRRARRPGSGRRWRRPHRSGAAHAAGSAGHRDAQWLLTRRGLERRVAARRRRRCRRRSRRLRAGNGSAFSCSAVSASGGTVRGALKVSIESSNSRSLGSSPPLSMRCSTSPSKYASSRRTCGSVPRRRIVNT